MCFLAPCSSLQTFFLPATGGDFLRSVKFSPKKRRQKVLVHIGLSPICAAAGADNAKAIAAASKVRREKKGLFIVWAPDWKFAARALRHRFRFDQGIDLACIEAHAGQQIGRASCRERVYSSV